MVLAPLALALARPPGWLEGLLPASVLGYRFLGVEAWQWAGILVALAGSILAAALVAGLVLRLLARLAARTTVKWDDLLVEALRAPIRLLVGLLTFAFLIGELDLRGKTDLILQALLHVALILAFAWMVFRTIDVASQALLDRHPDETDMRTRGLRTQVTVMKRVLQVLVVFFAGALALLQFEVVRSVGVSLLASAGVAGIVLGLAAQKTLGSIIAGIQLSWTQPLRLGDSVSVENEFGTVEEIHLTYVVVKVWDQRRLVVPITRFLDSTFQNWTRTSTALSGTVELFADYTVPVERVREEMLRLCGSHRLWDRRACGLQVTEVTQMTVKLRGLVSAASAGDLWDLRCDLREQLVRFLSQLEDGRYLPRSRSEAPSTTTGATRSAVA